MKRLIRKANNIMKEIIADWKPIDINDPNLVQIVTDAMAASAQIQINYQNSGWRLIQPYGWSSSRDSNILLMCYKSDTNEIRSYRLDRILEVLVDDNLLPEIEESTNEMFQIEDYHANPEEYKMPELPNANEILEISEQENGDKSPYEEALETLKI